MIVKKEYIRKDDLAIRLSDSLYRVYELFDEYRVSHLPVVSEKGKFLGLISEDDAYEQYDTQKNIQNNNIAFQKIFISESDSLFKGIKIITEHKLSVLPIICNKEQYMGYITPLDIVTLLGLNTSFTNQGVLLSLQVNNRDYSLNEITRLVEGDNAHVTALYIEDVVDKSYMLVHLKINTDDLSRIIHTLERFSYLVVNTFQKSDLDDDEEFKFNSFLKFLNP